MITFAEILRSEYAIHLTILIGIYLILGQSLNLTVGLGQLFNLAHIAAYAIGAYTTALLATDGGAGTPVCVLASIIGGALFGFVVALVARRLSTDYFAIGTLALSALVGAILVNWRELTHGVLGITAIPRPELGSFDFNRSINFLALIGIAAALVQLGCALIARGPFGRALRAAAQAENGAAALGVDCPRVRSTAIILSAALSALAGSFFAYYLNYIDPSSFGLGEMIFVLTIVILGRPGSVAGVAGATVFLILLPESLRFFPLDPSVLGPLRQLLYAVVLFLIVLLRRNSLFPQQREV